MHIASCLIAALGLGSSALADIIRVPEDVPSISEAVAQAGLGDRILIGPGTWQERVILDGRGLTLEGVAGADRTVLDGGGAGGPVVTIVDDAAGKTTLRGLTVTGGSGMPNPVADDITIGGGVLIQGSSPLIERCWIMGNRVRGEGGGVWAGGGSRPRFVSCRFASNSAERGGAVYLRDSPSVFASCRFRDNTAMYGGGGVFADMGSVCTLTDCEFRACRAEFNGGGVYVYDTSLRFVDCSFVRNSAGFAGGAVYQGFRGEAHFDSCTFQTQVDSVAGGASAAVRPSKGACRVGQACIETTEQSCVEAGGRWSGPRTTCVQVLAAMAPRPAPGDLNGDQQVDIRDVGLMMSLWGHHGSDLGTSQMRE